MNPLSFRLKKDWFIQTDILGIKNRTLILTEGHVISPTENGEYHIIYGGWCEENPLLGGRMILDESGMRLAQDIDGSLLFDIIEPKQEIKLTINELNDEDELKVSNWRIQLDVKTSRKKLKQIEKFIKEKISEFL